MWKPEHRHAARAFTAFVIRVTLERRVGVG